MNLKTMMWKLIEVVVITLAALVVVSSPWRGTVSAQNGVGRFSYLQIQAGDATPAGGKEVVDMRNGNVWVCMKGSCTRKERLAFEQIVDSGSR